MPQEAENQDIELELPEGEGDVPAVEVVEETTAQQESKKDELDQISDSVQKRIDKLTYKMREAERQRDEAVNYAQSMTQNNTTLKEKLKNSDSSLFKEYDNRVQSDIDKSKILLKEAQDAGDANAVADATEKLSRASAEAENLRRLSAQQQIREQKLKKFLSNLISLLYNQNSLRLILKQRLGLRKTHGLETTKR